MIDVEQSRPTFEREAMSMGIDQAWLDQKARRGWGYNLREADRLWQAWAAALVYANSLRQEAIR